MERIFPDGCPGIVINLGAPCKTDNGLAIMDYGKTYVVGGIYEISKRNFITVRQLERIFKTHIGLTPKEYVRIIRFQSALSMMSDRCQKKSLSDIAFECGFYDQAHLTNEVKRHTGFTPAQF